MKIIKAQPGFSGSINVGKRCFIIEANIDGVETDINYLSSKASFFNYVIFMGEPLKQRDDVNKIINNVIKVNPDIVFEIRGSGMYRPAGLKHSDNIIFVISILLKNSEIKYDKRIDKRILKWFEDYGAIFRFDVFDEDDVDEAKLLIEEFNLKKKKIYLTYPGEASKRQLMFLKKYSKDLNCNFTLDYDILFWKEEDKK